MFLLSVFCMGPRGCLLCTDRGEESTRTHCISWNQRYELYGSSSLHWFCTSLNHHNCSSQPNIYPIVHLIQAWRRGIHELHPEHLHLLLGNEDAKGIVALWLAMQVVESSQSSQMALAMQPELFTFLTKAAWAK